MTIIQSLLSPFVPFTPSTGSIVNATGGDDVVLNGNYKVHIFTGPGTFTVHSAPPTIKITYFVVAGGGGGGAGGEDGPPFYTTVGYCGGGGGAGGVRKGSIPLRSFTPGVGQIPPSGPGPWVLPVIVGAGGAGGVDNVLLNPTPGPPTGAHPMISGYGFPGSDSTLGIYLSGAPGQLEAYGGGGGGATFDPGYYPGFNPPAGVFRGLSGGSGGGSRMWVRDGSNTPVSGGSGTSPPGPWWLFDPPSNPTGDYPAQGYPGGGWPGSTPGNSPVRTWGGGGGDSGPPSGASTTLVPANYGTPDPTWAPSRIFAGGGQGGTRPPYNAIPVAEPASPGTPTRGGGGAKNPLNSPTNPAAPGMVNTGGGGAGASGTTPGVAGGAGGPGIVIVAYIYI